MKGKEKEVINDPLAGLPDGMKLPVEAGEKVPFNEDMEPTEVKSKSMIINQRPKGNLRLKSQKEYKTKKVGDINSRQVNNSNIVNQLTKELEMKNPNVDSIRRLRKHIEPISKVTLENDELVELINLAKNKEDGLSTK